MWRNNKVLKYNKVLQQQNINIKALSLSAWNIAFEEDFKQRLRSLFQVVVLVSVDIGTINICLTIYNYFTHAILYHSNSNSHRVSCMCRTSRTDNIQALQAVGCKNSSTVVYHLWACFDRSPDSRQLRSVSALFCFNSVRVFKIRQALKVGRRWRFFWNFYMSLIASVHFDGENKYVCFIHHKTLLWIFRAKS